MRLLLGLKYGFFLYLENILFCVYFERCRLIDWKFLSFSQIFFWSLKLIKYVKFPKPNMKKYQSVRKKKVLLKKRDFDTIWWNHGRSIFLGKVYLLWVFFVSICACWKTWCFDWMNKSVIMFHGWKLRYLLNREKFSTSLLF